MHSERGVREDCMTRLHPAAPAARTLRALIGLGAAFILAVVASGCAGSQPPAPTPDPFVGLADRSDQAFRQVTLAMVPGRDADAPAASQFFFQDQIGLHIGGLKQHLRLPFALRVFKTDTGTLVADVHSDDSATPTGAPTTVVSGINNLVA